MNAPRILIAGTNSGSGKTTAVSTILTLIRRRGLNVRALKCGPDYIDPMFHEKALGIPCTNLDPFFCDSKLLRHLLLQNAGSDITVIEGVMGYYDGTGRDGTDNSTYSVARLTDTPVILVVNASGASTSLLAVIEGFRNYRADSNIRGVIFNGITRSTYETIKQQLSSDIVPLGYIPKFGKELRIPSRHLGLVTAGEIDDISKKQNDIADLCEMTIDLDMILELAGKADELEDSSPIIPQKAPINLAYAKDEAFCFYYTDTLRLFEKMGATLLPFSPLKNEPIPSEADGLLLPGGYPELHADKLERNTVSKESVKAAVEGGMPTIAECGGFQYLGQKLDGREMCGVLPHESNKTDRLVRFGYVTLSSQKDSLFGEKGTMLKGHEFHYWDSTDCGDGFSCLKPNGRIWKSGVLTDTMYAGYPHLFLYQNIDAAGAFYDKCLGYKESRK
ncbi:MAG: cobyrinate a,c-diamide synthase [Clostridia bacterium]|nr:cobyrinate a,c-diamide synthase [Clostridia bacterium]